MQDTANIINSIFLFSRLISLWKMIMTKRAKKRIAIFVFGTVVVSRKITWDMKNNDAKKEWWSLRYLLAIINITNGEIEKRSGYRSLNRYSELISRKL